MVPAVLACPQPFPGPDRWAKPLKSCVIYFQSTLWLFQHHSGVDQYGGDSHILQEAKSHRVAQGNSEATTGQVLEVSHPSLHSILFCHRVPHTPPTFIFCTNASLMSGSAECPQHMSALH